VVGRLVWKMVNVWFQSCHPRAPIDVEFEFMYLKIHLLKKQKYCYSDSHSFGTPYLCFLVQPGKLFHSACTKLRSTSFCHQPPIRESANLTRTTITWALLGLIKFSKGRWTHLSFRHVIQSTEKHISRDCNHFQSRVLWKRCSSDVILIWRFNLLRVETTISVYRRLVLTTLPWCEISDLISCTRGRMVKTKRLFTKIPGSTPGRLNVQIKVGLGITRTNTDSQWNPVYNAFHRIFGCGNKTICR